MSTRPMDPDGLTAARERAERSGDDAALLATRELELAASQLPPVIDGARRLRLLHADAIATTWEGWDTKRGGRALLRCLRPQWRRDPVMLRRMSKALLGPEPPRWLPDGDWPHLRADAPGALLVDRLPAEDPPDGLMLARALGGGLHGLARLHAAGLVHGAPNLAHLVEGRDGVRLVWVDHFGVSGGVETDLAVLGLSVAALDPDGTDHVGQLAADWADSPPPSAQDGLRLLQRALASNLLHERHRLRFAARATRARADVLALLALTRRLSEALPAPVGRFCVRADTNGVLVIVQSDGATVRGGAAAVVNPRFLPVLYSPERGLDAQAARAVMRAWAKRDDGDVLLRREMQEDVGGDDKTAGALMRWLSAHARLRAARLLMEKSGSVRVG